MRLFYTAQEVYAQFGMVSYSTALPAENAAFASSSVILLAPLAVDGWRAWKLYVKAMARIVFRFQFLGDMGLQ